MLNFVLLVTIVAGICSCQKCILPTSGDLEDVIIEIFQSEDASSTPAVNVMSFHPVCLALDGVQDRYRAVSVLVEYTCSANPSCPSGTAVEQIESECNNGVWSSVVQGSTNYTRSQTPEVSLSTSTREDCAFCVSPELGDVLSLTTDSVTHCVACDSSCSEGLMGCTGPGADECCNYYNNSMCVDECLSPFQPNTANECVCPPGTTGHNCTELEEAQAEVFLPFLLPPTIIQGPEDCDPSYTTSARNEVNTVVSEMLTKWRGEQI